MATLRVFNERNGDSAVGGKSVLATRISFDLFTASESIDPL